MHVEAACFEEQVAALQSVILCSINACSSSESTN